MEAAAAGAAKCRRVGQIEQPAADLFVRASECALSKSLVLSCNLFADACFGLISIVNNHKIIVFYHYFLSDSELQNLDIVRHISTCVLLLSDSFCSFFFVVPS